MKLKTVFLGLLILAGSLFGGAKGYIYYRVSSELDKFISMADPFAEIRYQGISSSFEGSIAVENITIYPTTSNDEITIESAQMHGDGPGFLYQLFMGGLQNKPPEKFGLSVKGFSIPLDGDLAVSYSSMLESAKQASGVKDSDGCGLLTGISPNLLGSLGFYAITMDTTLDVDFDQAAGRAEMQIGFDVRDVEYSQMTMVMTGVSEPGAIMIGMQKPQLSKVSVIYQTDPEFVAKSQKHCAELRGLTVDAFVASMLELDEQQLAQQLGFVPGPGLLAAIKSFIKNPKEASFSIHPSEAVDPATLSFYKPEEIPSILNLQLSVNGEPVTDLSFSMLNQTAEGASASVASQLPGTADVFAPAARQAKKLKTPEPTLQFVQTPIAQLHKYIDEDVRVYINQEDVVRKGALVSVTKDKIVIKQRLSGGNMTASVPLEQIAKVEVYRLPD